LRTYSGAWTPSKGLQGVDIFLHGPHPVTLFATTPDILHIVRYVPMSSWTWTSSNAHRSRLRLSSCHVATAGVVASLLYLFFIFAVPQLQRLRFRTDLSRYDLGLYGFGPTRGYVSFDYESPIVEITESESGCDQRYTFIAPRGDSVPQAGPMILDAQGNLVWMKYNWETTQDFKIQHYRGEDYLTYWEGREIESRGYGSWYMVCSIGHWGEWTRLTISSLTHPITNDT
jgi:hypothetical protein